MAPAAGKADPRKSAGGLGVNFLERWIIRTDPRIVWTLVTALYVGMGIAIWFVFEGEVNE
jgi:hypothetical protein